MRPYVKICGLTSLEDARFCASAGADYLGFIQYPRSPRYITPGEAAAIMEWIHGPFSVGVFVNEDASTVNRVAAKVGFDYVQLHGDESPAYCRRMTRPVIKAFRVRTDSSEASLLPKFDLYTDVVHSFLLDTWHPTLKGGTGKTFDWRLAQELAQSYPVMLSGGLGPANIVEAVRAVNPLEVDLSSGIESSPGKKEFELVTELFDALEWLNP